MRRSLGLHPLGGWTDDVRDLVVFPQDVYPDNSGPHDYTRGVLSAGVGAFDGNADLAIRPFKVVKRQDPGPLPACPVQETKDIATASDGLTVELFEEWEPGRGGLVVDVPVKGGEKPDQRAEQNTATAAVGVRWSEGVGMRPGAVSAGNEGRA